MGGWGGFWIFPVHCWAGLTLERHDFSLFFWDLGWEKKEEFGRMATLFLKHLPLFERQCGCGFGTVHSAHHGPAPRSVISRDYPRFRFTLRLPSTSLGSTARRRITGGIRGQISWTATSHKTLPLRWALHLSLPSLLCLSLNVSRA